MWEVPWALSCLCKMSLLTRGLSLAGLMSCFAEDGKHRNPVNSGQIYCCLTFEEVQATGRTCLCLCCLLYKGAQRSNAALLLVWPRHVPSVTRCAHPCSYCCSVKFGWAPFVCACEEESGHTPLLLLPPPSQKIQNPKTICS